jgi:hypothetical protein
MAAEPRDGSHSPGRDSSGEFANNRTNASAPPYKDSPLSHPGSGGPGDDRQDNSSASQGSGSGQPSTETSHAGDERSESDPE